MRWPLPSARRSGAFFVAAAAAAALAGCSDPPAAGVDLAYLNTPLETENAAGANENMLPLTPGNYWDVLSQTQSGKENRDRMVVIGPVNVEGARGVQVDTQRGGARWRREIYRSDKVGVSLAAMQDETSPLMRLDPPLPLLRYPVKDGAGLTWRGEFRMGKESWPATGFSRISGHEDVKTPAGSFKTIRLDTVVVVNRSGGEIRFPMVRWLAPRVGFVRRGYAEKGLPAFSQVTRFNVQ